MENIRSPMDNLANMLSRFSTGHEKALKQGIYNAVAFLFLGLVSAAAYGLYIILNPFIKPLIWALFCGSVLFPFKYSLATTVQSWFDKTESSNQPLIFSLTVLPMHIIDQISEGLGSFLWRHVKYVMGVALTAALILCVYCYTPTILTCLVWRILLVFNTIFNFFIFKLSNIYMIAAVVVGYIIVLCFHWTPNTSVNFHYTSFGVWLLITLYISHLAGPYQVIVFLILQGLCIIGFIYEVVLIMEDQESEGRQMTFMEAINFALKNETIVPQQQDTLTPLITEKSVDSFTEEQSTPYSSTKDFKNRENVQSLVRVSASSSAKLSKKSMSLDAASLARNRYFLGRLRNELRKSIEIDPEEVDTDKYMYGALYACVGMLIWNHRWVIFILSVPIVIYTLKRIGSYFDFWTMIFKQCFPLFDLFKSKCMERHQAIVPANIRGLYRLSLILDEKLRKLLKSSISAVATISVILGLLIFTTCTSVFITIQIYTEGMHLIQVTGEIVNATLVNNPDIDWLPNMEQWEDSVNNVLDNAYTYGRGAISDGVKGVVKDLDPVKAEQLEKKVLELWDRLYQAWMMSNSHPDLIGPTVDVTAAYSVWESFKESYGGTPLQLFNMTSLQNFVKDNIGIFMSVLDSIWSIVERNMSVMLNLFWEIFYIVLISGSAVLNFTLSMVVFFTALFYLLNSSNKTYKPVELITMFSPISCHRFVVALQEAIIGVFAATFKLASFFGMWTWFVHNMFQVKIVYLPSTLATILGAVPFLDAYFACIPATLELWFTRGPMIAILFFLFHFIPCNIVVTEFYKEIKGGGHPYLTGLSIAGGIFCLGVEGAIFGPVLLCCIMVVINFGRRYLNSPLDEIAL